MYNYIEIYRRLVKNHCSFKHLSKTILKIRYMRENNEIIKNNLKKAKIYDDQTLENMKKYYNINDSTDLLKFIKSNGLMNHDHDYDKK
jgi:hypothetical protein